MSPPIRLRSCEDRRLCPVIYLKEYVARTELLRENHMQFFISPHVPHRPVKLATLRRWITAVLREGVVNGTEGSTWATTATCALLHGVPLQHVMECADWSRPSTLLRHYMCILPEETLQSVEAKQSLVQNTVLPHSVVWLHIPRVSRMDML